jgi:hypothetical protein
MVMNVKRFRLHEQRTSELRGDFEDYTDTLKNKITICIKNLLFEVVGNGYKY